MNYEEYYPDYELSAADEIINKAAAELTVEIKTRASNKVNAILKDNERLSEENKNFRETLNSALADARKAKNEYEGKIKNLESEFYRAKISDIIDKMNIRDKCYYVDYEHVQLSKCEHCDNNRQIQLTDKAGRSYKVTCQCSVSIKIYELHEAELIKLDFYKEACDRNLKGYFFMRNNESNHDSWYWERFKTIVDKFDESLSDDYHKPLYTSIEEAQKHCDFLNKSNQ